MKRIKIGLIGLGQRGQYLLNQCILEMEDVDVVAVCDEYQDRVDDTVKLIKEKKDFDSIGTTDYREVLAIEEIEAIVICTAWEMHTEISIAAMKAGKYVGVEVGGAYDISDCWDIIKTHEETKVPVMMLENCCYGRREMQYLNMIRQNLFGEIVHCEGGYRHDIRDEISDGNKIRHYRLRNYTLRNCDNYPTHALGPLAKMLNINNGNQFLTLNSVASKSASLEEYIAKNYPDDEDLRKRHFKQGDVITTIIKCAGGETITLKLDTTCPAPYCRLLVITGTQGLATEINDSIYLEKDFGHISQAKWTQHWNNATTTYRDKYEHPLWKKFLNDGVRGGHGGMDWLVLRAFFESASLKLDTPIDAYDTVAWMSISTLSEESIAKGGAPVKIPDFTRGRWIKGFPKKKLVEDYRLDIIPEIEL